MKKLNQKGFAHHLLIFALLALVVGAAGFAGWRVWSNKNIDAQAAGYTILGELKNVNFSGTNKGTLTFKACKYSVDKWSYRAKVINTASNYKAGVTFSKTAYFKLNSSPYFTTFDISEKQPQVEKSFGPSVQGKYTARLGGIDISGNISDLKTC